MRDIGFFVKIDLKKKTLATTERERERQRERDRDRAVGCRRVRLCLLLSPKRSQVRRNQLTHPNTYRAESMSNRLGGSQEGNCDSKFVFLYILLLRIPLGVYIVTISTDSFFIYKYRVSLSTNVDDSCASLVLTIDRD